MESGKPFTKVVSCPVVKALNDTFAPQGEETSVPKLGAKRRMLLFCAGVAIVLAGVQVHWIGDW